MNAEKDWLQGDGILLYAGQDGAGRPVPVDSSRLDNLRDGLLDVELMYQVARNQKAAGVVGDLQELVSTLAGESRLTAAIPMDNPYCSCKLTHVRSGCSSGRTQPERLRV